jgi:hypothetical protein
LIRGAWNKPQLQRSALFFELLHSLLKTPDVANQLI